MKQHTHTVLNIRSKWPWFDCQSSPTGAGRLQVRFCFKFDTLFCQQKKAILCDEAALTWWHMAHPNRYMFADPMNPDDKTGLLVTVWLWPKVSIEGLMSSWILQFSLRSAPNYCYRCGNVGPQMVEQCFWTPTFHHRQNEAPGRFDPGCWWAGQKGVTQPAMLVVSPVGALWKLDTLQGTNISPQNGILKMSFLFPRWDMLISWRVFVGWIFPPGLQVPHLSGSAGISCCGAGVWGGGFMEMGWTCCGSLCRFRQGEVFGEDLWVVAQVPPRQLVPYFLWCPLPAEMGERMGREQVPNIVICIHRHTSC